MDQSWRRLIEPRRLLVAMAVYALVGGAVGAYVVLSDRAETKARVARSTASSALLLEDHVRRTLAAAEAVALRAGARVLDREDEAQGLDDLLISAPYLANLYVVDPSGRLRADARAVHAPGADFAALPWVQSLRGGDRAGGATGAAVFDEPSRSFAFPVVRQVRDGDGTLLGLAAAMVDVGAFKPFHQGLDGNAAPQLGVAMLDGAVLVRQPLTPEGVGQGMAGSAIFKRHLPKAVAGTLTDRPPQGGPARVVSYRAMEQPELVVWVGVDPEGALSHWRLRAARVILLGMASMVVMGGLTLLLVRELANQRRIAQHLGTANQDLERSNADLEQFAYIASHDLKEPLRNIASYVQLLQRRYEGQLDPDADAFIGYTVDGVRRMQAIINELLAYSRVGTGKLAMAQVQAGAAVSTALAQLRIVIAEAQAAVEVKGPLPVVQADPPQLASLFQNLIGNGIKYRRPEMRPEVTIGVEDHGVEWAFYVADNGIGIETQYHGQIFELFKRLHPRDHYGGTGIGLATCKRVVGRHGGRIWVESEPGRGSTFWFTLPKADKA